MSNNHSALGSEHRPNKRIAKGLLSVVRVSCPFCGHDKALYSVSVRKCARCKRRLK